MPLADAEFNRRIALLLGWKQVDDHTYWTDHRGTVLHRAYVLGAEWSTDQLAEAAGKLLSRGCSVGLTALDGGRWHVCIGDVELRKPPISVKGGNTRLALLAALRAWCEANDG